jgi:hypothetical protein
VETKFVSSQFNLVQLFQVVACIAILLVSRSCWLTFQNPSIPCFATIALGTVLAILVERTKVHLVIVLITVLAISILQFGLYSWECLRNSDIRDFPHIVSYPYARDVELYMIVGTAISFVTVVVGFVVAAGIRYFR